MLHHRRAFTTGSVPRTQHRRACVLAKAAAPTLVDSPLLKDISFLQPHWSNVETEEQFLAVLKAQSDAGLCPKQLLPLWQDFYNNYKLAILSSNQEGANIKLASKVQSTIADTVLNQFIQPYTFPSFHTRITEPYNYYEFGQRYVGSLINYETSVLGQPQHWARIAALLKEGHNVVLLANHQTEADPGVFAHMLAHSHPELSTNVIYVAGDRVVTDPLCKPFSMGRNLFCVHSKKHLDDVPELKAQKMETNRKTLIAMQRRLNEGGCLMWIAPSGGRDRPKADDKWSPDAFDPTAVELMRSLVSRAKKPGHLYPMAMYSWPMMPPPKTVDKALGERRITHFTPVGITVGEELNVEAVLSGIEKENKEEQQKALANAAWTATCKMYDEMEAAILHPETRSAQFVQPWKQ